MISTIREKLKERLETIGGLRGYAQPPNVIGNTPCAIVDWDPDAADYAQPGDLTIWSFRILLLLGKFDASKGYEEIDKYVAKTGPKSIKYNVELGDDVGDYVYVQKCVNLGVIAYKNVGQQYYGAEFIVEVGDTE